MNVRDVLLANLDAAYEKKGWHGPTLKGAIRGLTSAEVFARPAHGRHDIWELTTHAAYWKYVVRRRLSGERPSFPLEGSNWFPSPAARDEQAWRSAVELLASEHHQLRELIASLPDAALADPKKLRMIYGVAAHDVYHAGQISLVKRLVAG